MTNTCLDPAAETTSQAISCEALTVKVFTTVEEVEQHRAEWNSWPGHRDSDLDFYLMILSARPEVVSPYVVALYRGKTPHAVLLGRVEERHLNFRVGYLSIFRPKVRILAMLAWGFRGEQSAEASHLFVSELLRSLRNNKGDLAQFNFIDCASPVFSLAHQLPGQLSRDRFPSQNVHWTMDLSSDIDAVYKRFSGEHRAQVRRKIRKLFTEFGDRAQVKCFTKCSDIPTILRDVEEVAKKTYQRGLGVGFSVSPEMQARLQFQAEKGWLRTYILYIDDVPCAFWVGSVYQGDFYSDYLGHDPAYDKHSVGIVLTMKTIEALCAEGVERLDFGPGHSRYKQQFGTHKIDESTIYIFAPSLRGIALNAMRTTTELADRFIKVTLEKTQLLERVKKLMRKRATQSAAIPDGSAEVAS